MPWAMMLWSWVVRSQWQNRWGWEGGFPFGVARVPLKKVGGELKLAKDIRERIPKKKSCLDFIFLS